MVITCRDWDAIERFGCARGGHDGVVSRAAVQYERNYSRCVREIERRFGQYGQVAVVIIIVWLSVVYGEAVDVGPFVSKLRLYLGTCGALGRRGDTAVN